ncbi:MAG: AAA family ATPase [Burkholderiaceae bacterium]|nr:AAA family ATPase [Burkholderiaceae bacterium]
MTLANISIDELRARVDKMPAERKVNGAPSGDATTAERHAPASRPIVVRSPMDWAELANREPPPRTWAIHGWLPFAPTLEVGAGGVGKTLISQQVGTALAIGRDFIGKIDEPLRVLMWACEDDHDELWRRQRAICEWLGVGMAHLAGQFIIEPRLGRENTLFTAEYARPLWTSLLDELAEQVNDYAADVLFLDNAGQVFGGNENDRHQVTAFMNGMAGLARTRRFAPVVMGHPARASGSEYAGSAAWENAARMRWYLGARLPDAKPDENDEPDESERFLCKRKTNYSEKDYIRMTYQGGVLVPDTPLEAGLEGMTRALREKQALRVVLDGFRRLRETGQCPTAAPNSGAYLLRLILDARLNEGLTKSQLKSALATLVLDKQLVIAPIGTYANRTPRMGLVEAGP